MKPPPPDEPLPPHRKIGQAERAHGMNERERRKAEALRANLQRRKGKIAQAAQTSQDEED